jgi:hypothetical protein
MKQNCCLEQSFNKDKAPAHIVQGLGYLSSSSGIASAG